MERHLSARSGERQGRLKRGHGHAEQLFLHNVWWPLRGDFGDLHPEYEVLDWRGRSYFADFAYLPIDISDNVISYLNATLPVTLPGIKISGLNGEYFDMLKKAAAISNRRKVVLFLGSNIGNMPVNDAEEFCKELRKNLSAGDMVLMGIDLKKNPKTVLAAYNDKEGITKRFNLNLLERINRELNADFNLTQFDHYPVYDPETGACKSYLVSLADQQVKINGKKDIHFFKDEYIYMEISQKYSVMQSNQMASASGFKPLNIFFDSKKWFIDAIWLAE